KFKKEYNYVQFEATRQEESFLLDLKIIIKQSLTGYIDPYSKIRRHQKYVIDSVKVFTNFSTTSEDSTTSHAVVKDDISFIYQDKEFIKANTLKNFNTCYPNSLYDIQEIELTTNKLSSLGLFKMVNITPIEKVPKRNEVSEFGHLNYQIELVPRKRQNFQTELIGTISSNDPGAGATFSYSNYNLLRGAERLTLKLSGVIERVKRLATQDQQQDFKREFKVETKIEIPKFFIPLRASEFTRKYNPKTTINLSYNYQDRIEYLGTLFNASFGYYWKGNKFTKHSVIPLDVNYINIKIRKNEFYDDIKGTPLENSFTSHSILGLRYSFEYSTQVIEKLDNYFYFKYNFESAGFLLDLAKKNVGFLGPDSTLFDVTYSNFVKSDIELRKYYKQARDNWLVFRFFAGVGIPYGNNAISLPYEKMYFSGGPYGIRAWETRTLGPGSDTTVFGGYANNMGDIKLEANVEYRFDLFWKFEGAIFLDAGNIWLIKEDISRPKAVFKWDKFHTEFALGTGFGLRLDLSFLLARFDIGYKLRDPALNDDTGRWTFNQYYDPFKLWSFQLGIGYPF
ncbi:MAG: BamA/TamA family outer membrane protein, partial [Bacteroidales bacterium]|nr:BamA/TamA family outer membrane protein [Bacteroidales bacterium]